LVILADMYWSTHRCEPVNLILLITQASSATRWAFAEGPPQYQPLPRKAPLNFIRQTTAFKALDLPLNEFRLLSIAPYSLPLKRSRHGYFLTLLYHLAMFTLHMIMFDLFTAPVYYLDPHGIGEPHGKGRDYQASLTRIAIKTGVRPGVVKVGLSALLGINVYNGMATTWHIAAIVGIGSGIYTGEEFPKYMNKPWLATSLSEFWSKRYHQVGPLDKRHELTAPVVEGKLPYLARQSSLANTTPQELALHHDHTLPLPTLVSPCPPHLPGLRALPHPIALPLPPAAQHLAAPHRLPGRSNGMHG
jgi:hypothetical protein